MARQDSDERIAGVGQEHDPDQQQRRNQVNVDDADDDDVMFHIIIVGAGIGGLAAAIALTLPPEPHQGHQGRRRRRVTLLEASAMNREVGAAISLQPNASKIIEKWGIADELWKIAKAQVDRAFKIYTTTGKLQVDIPLRRETYGADRMLFHRVDLHDGLKRIAASTPNVTIRTSAKVVRVDTSAGLVHLQNGETLTGHLVIGADGIHSKVRPSVLGTARLGQPTGLSAYRLIVPVERVQHIPEIATIMNDVENPVTTMVIGHDCRVIMGPCRQSTLLCIVGLVPDAKMHESSTSDSWTEKGSLEDLLESFKEFPEWIKEAFKGVDRDEIGLWQIRDLEPLETWISGRTILIGDAAHAMMMTQGQGASQTIEDAEALGALLADYDHTTDHDGQDLGRRLQAVFDARYDRVTTVQAYSRAQAKPGTAAKGSEAITMNPKEFMDFNCQYEGALDWIQRQQAKEETQAGLTARGDRSGVESTTISAQEGKQAQQPRVMTTAA